MGEKKFGHDGFAEAEHVQRVTRSRTLPLVFFPEPNKLINDRAIRQADIAPHRWSGSWKDARQSPRSPGRIIAEI